MTEAENLIQCYNRGCGKKFDPNENNDGACQHHPGQPVFHDALKGWSCCPKRYRDFTEFLNIPGCSKGLHNNVKPPEPEKPKPLEIAEERIQTNFKPEHKPIEAPPPRPSEDEPLVRLKSTVGASLQGILEKHIENLKLKESEGDKEVIDEINVPVGTSCKNNACNKTYQGESSNSESCIYHPGQPIFHEGMKYWSCCQRKTSDFDNFLNQEGCEYGKHLWIAKEDPEKKVNCRIDWHQTATFVTVSIFAKVPLPEKCWVECNKVKMSVHIAFDGGNSIYIKDYTLKGVIDPLRSSIKLLGTKVELNLRKAEPGSWSGLELVKQENGPENGSAAQ